MTQNTVTVTGRIAFEPKSFDTKKGGKIASAVLNVYKGKDTDGKAQYASVPFKTFEKKYAESIVNLGKGADVIISGRLDEETYEKDGKTIRQVVVIADYVGTEA